MLRGKYWITPHGVIDVTISEHALYVKNHLLELGDREAYRLPDTFRPLTIEDYKVHLSRGIKRQILDFLVVKGNDPRTFAIERLGWIRTRKDRFYVNEFNRETRRQVREANLFWAAQPSLQDQDYIEVFEAVKGYREPSLIQVSNIV